MSNTNEKAQSAEEFTAFLVDHLVLDINQVDMFKPLLEGFISQLEQDLAKSQEKCKGYEEALETSVKGVAKKMYQEGVLRSPISRQGQSNMITIIDKIESDIIEQALKPKEDDSL